MNAVEKAKELGINLDILTLNGSMNIIVNVAQDENNPRETEVFRYLPRKQKITSVVQPTEDIIPEVEESIERLKILQYLLQQWLDKKVRTVYYPELGEERYDGTKYNHLSSINSTPIK